ncbi:class-II aminoacyl-tRNA synthetase family protein [Xylanibacillus composti]|uniref:Aminoacyl-transfer RNA synthetases class-II family profile domain-containing protein n=1 Tax=Xylanibacillus composti TaxID=1572762 RepID=A0A8J4M3B4_9BACL|nr:amino acid--ACP ligase [Xylanibacillus composti]GIQ69366.1 hypothetical protein XYCOK13_21900 [Xylanibacillus composti]
MKKCYVIDDVLNRKQADLLLAKLIYSVEGIAGCRLDDHSQTIQVDLLPGCDQEELDETVHQLIEEVRSQRVIASRMYVQRDGHAWTGQADIEEAFADNGSVRRGLAVALFERIDRKLLALAERYGSEQRKYPSMIPLDILDKCRYIPAFPQNIHLVSEIPHRLNALKQARQPERLPELARLSPYALAPAVCFHCYAELAGSRLQAPLALTARGRCYRHEAPWRLGKHRLNEFSMREIVLFGHDDYVETQRKHLIDETWALFASLGLPGKIETASDLFYFSDESDRGQHQLAANLKYELIVTPEAAPPFSIASFNYMGDSLCKPFCVTDRGGNPLQSGCAAFGLDRWVYALLLAYGPDDARWPAQVHAVLNAT